MANEVAEATKGKKRGGNYSTQEVEAILEKYLEIMNSGAKNKNEWPKLVAAFMKEKNFPERSANSYVVKRDNLLKSFRKRIHDNLNSLEVGHLVYLLSARKRVGEALVQVLSSEETPITVPSSDFEDTSGNFVKVKSRKIIEDEDESLIPYTDSDLLTFNENRKRQITWKVAEVVPKFTLDEEGEDEDIVSEMLYDCMEISGIKTAVVFFFFFF